MKTELEGVSKAIKQRGEAPGGWWGDVSGGGGGDKKGGRWVGYKGNIGIGGRVGQKSVTLQEFEAEP